MRGVFLRYLERFVIVNLTLIVAFLGFVFFTNSEHLAHYSFVNYILDGEQIFKQYVLQNEYINWFIYGFVLLNVLIIFWALKNFKYLNLSYALGFFNDIKQFECFDKRTKVYFDKFTKKVKYKNGNFSLFFKNRVSILPNKYDDAKKKIAQYLFWYGDIKVIEHKGREIELFFYKLATKYSLFIYKVDFIHFGRGIYGDFYIHIKEMTHAIIVGESGSGKSNFLHHLFQSFIINLKYIDYILMIDLKGNELSFYENYNFMHLTSKIDEVKNKLLVIRDEMNLRFQTMKDNKQQMYEGKYKFIVIDEVGSIGTHHNKKLRDEIFNLMIEISQKGRAAKVLLFIFSQKIDSTNIPSNVLANLQTKVLMKTDSDFNINNTIGKKEDLEKITLLDIDSFPRGRAIIKNGYTSEKTLIQVPLVELENMDKK